MGDDPVAALISAVLLGMGTLIVYGAIRNKKVFGAKGIVPTAISTGSLADLSKVPAAFGSISVPIPSPAQELQDAGKTLLDKIRDQLAGGGTTARWQLPAAVREAVMSIAQRDPTMAERIAAELSKMDSQSSKAELLPLQALLQLASAQGSQQEVFTIRTYVRELTGESV